METTDFVRGWLQGFFDGEGTVFIAVYPNKRRARSEGEGRFKRTVNRVIRLNNTDRTLIDRCSDYLTRLGICHRITTVRPRNPKHKLQWAICIGTNSDIARYCELVGFSSSAKAATMAAIYAWVTRDTSHGKHRDIQLRLVI